MKPKGKEDVDWEDLDEKECNIQYIAISVKWRGRDSWTVGESVKTVSVYDSTKKQVKGAALILVMDLGITRDSFKDEKFKNNAKKMNNKVCYWTQQLKPLCSIGGVKVRTILARDICEVSYPRLEDVLRGCRCDYREESK